MRELRELRELRERLRWKRAGSEAIATRVECGERDEVVWTEQAGWLRWGCERWRRRLRRRCTEEHVEHGLSRIAGKFVQSM